MSIRLLLADDHDLFRQGLKLLLEREGHLVVGEARDGRTAVDLARDLSPDIVLMDVRMPILNGIDAAERILKDNPHTKVIALSAQDDEESTRGALSSGACGYVLKHADFQELAAAIKAAMDGKAYLSPTIAVNVVRAYVHPPAAELPGPVLTSREREILQLTAEGQSAKVIAHDLHLSVKTVETHRRNIMLKTGVDSIAGLTRYAIQRGLSSL